MTATYITTSIASILYRYRDKGSITIANGTEFICKIDGAPMRFLHTLYRGSEATARDIADLWREPLPASYRGFVTRFNGANLFDNSFDIFGLVKDFNRGLSLEDQRALSIEHAIMERRHLAPPDAEDALPVASIAAATELFDAGLRRDGSVTLRDERGKARVFASFTDFVETLCVLLDNLTDANGLRDDTGEELQREMVEFISNSPS